MKYSSAGQTLVRVAERMATIGALAIVMALFATPASAAKKHFDRGHHRHQVATIESNGRHVQHGATTFAPVPGGFVVPTVIRSGRVEKFRPFYRGSVYYAPHGHAHTVYYFPVYRGRSYVHEPYHYCGTRLAAGAVVADDGPRVSFRIAF